MNTQSVTPFILLATLVLSSGVSAQTSTDADAQALRAIVVAIEKGWETADGQPFREHYLDVPSARYIESGGQNEGLDDLVFHHVEPEADALADLDLTFANLEFHINGDTAWVIADVEIKATVRRDQSKIHNRGYETFIFERIDGHWKVVHTHSSSRPVKPDEWH